MKLPPAFVPSLTKVCFSSAVSGNWMDEIKKLSKYQANKKILKNMLILKLSVGNFDYVQCITVNTGFAGLRS